MGGIDTERVRRKQRQQSGLITEAVVLEEERQKEMEQAEVAASAPTPSLRRDSGRGKTQWYLPHELLDELRDAVDHFKVRGLKVDGRAPNVGLLVEPAIRALIHSLRDEHNGGKPFPESPSTAAAKAKRLRRR